MKSILKKLNMKLFRNLFLYVLFVFPSFIFAAPFNGIKDMLNSIKDIIKLALPLAFSLAVLFFFWGIAKYILKAGDSKAREEGKNIMLWGVIALFVLVSVWGIVGFIQENLGIKGKAGESSNLQGGIPDWGANP